MKNNVLTNNFDLVIYSKEYPQVPEGSLIPKVKNSPVISDDVLK